MPTGKEDAVVSNDKGEEIYTVTVEGKPYTVSVSNGGDITGVAAVGASASAPVAGAVTGGEPVPAPLAGNIFRVLVKPGQQVQEGTVIIILEAMKMETEISAPKAGIIGDIQVKDGDSVAVGDILLSIA